MSADPRCYDVLIVGAGLSGIGTAAHLLRDCPWADIALFEMRGDLGGTWSLFRYPGLRSDSDMFTLGYDFKPWTGAKAIADGRDILDYLRETAVQHDVLRRIAFERQVLRAAWSGKDALWSVESVCIRTGVARVDRCRVLFMAAGYYSYQGGHRPTFAGEADFAGRIVHPQDWPDDLDWTGQRVAVIGSGATAITLVPALAATAARVSMLQRSPTYVATVPSSDWLADIARRLLPRRWAYGLARAWNIAFSALIFGASRALPGTMRRLLLAGVRRELPGADIARDWTPHYNPWDERLCAVPEGDLFAAIRDGRAEVVTGEIERFIADGVRMADGRDVPADIVVTATGLKMVFLGEIELSVDGEPVRGGDKLIYKGCMFDGVPNLAYAFGYTNASWTLKVDLTARWLARLLNHMRDQGLRVATPVRGPGIVPEDASGLKSDYIRRAAAMLPKQGPRRPWRLRNNYLLDWWELTTGAFDDGVLRLEAAPARDSAPIVPARGRTARARA